MPTPDQLKHTVSAIEAGGRLDRILRERFGAISRARFQRLIADGRVRVNGVTIVEARHRVKQGSEIAVTVPPPEPAAIEAEQIALDIVYEDLDLLVVNKPAGLVVHPSAGHWTGTLVNALMAHCGPSLSGIGGIRRPGIVHRLDKDTSGLMVVAKTDEAHRALSEQFRAHGRDGKLERMYLAIVWGRPSRKQASITAALGRSAVNRKKMAVQRGKGRDAITHYRVVKTYLQPGEPTLLECRLETGRTHQIRAHLAHLGHPLLGDQTYARGYAASARRLPLKAQETLAKLGRQALHAAVLGFEHPRTGKRLRFEVPFPGDLQSLVQAIETTQE